MTDQDPLGLPPQAKALAQGWARAAVANIEPLLDYLIATAADDEVKLAYARHSMRLFELVKDVEMGLALGRDTAFFLSIHDEIQRHIKSIDDIHRTQLLHGGRTAAEQSTDDGPPAGSL